LTASDDHDFTIDEAEVIYWGRCPGCVAAASAASRWLTADASSHKKETARQEKD
jgi:hypothetical protein